MELSRLRVESSSSTIRIRKLRFFSLPDIFVQGPFYSLRLLKLVPEHNRDRVGPERAGRLYQMEIGIVRGQVPVREHKIVFQQHFACRRVAGKILQQLTAAITQVLAAIVLAQSHAETRRTQVAAVLVRVEISVIEVFGEMNMAEGIAAAERKLVVVPRKPAQPLHPFALAAIAVVVVAQQETSGDGKVPGAIVEPAVPRFGQQIER